AARAGLPEIAFRVAQAGQFLPRLAAVGGFENRGVLGAGVDGVGIVERRFEVPDAFELPRMLRAVVPLVRADLAFVNELVAFTFGHAIGTFEVVGFAARRVPGLAAVVGPL